VLLILALGPLLQAVAFDDDEAPRKGGGEGDEEEMMDNGDELYARGPKIERNIDLSSRN